MTQALEAVFHRGHQDRQDYTPAAAVGAGQVRIENGIALVVTSPEGIEANALGSADNAGVYRFRKAVGGGVTFNQGDKMAWDLDGDAGDGVQEGADYASSERQPYLAQLSDRPWICACRG